MYEERHLYIVESHCKKGLVHLNYLYDKIFSSTKQGAQPEEISTKNSFLTKAGAQMASAVEQ